MMTGRERFGGVMNRTPVDRAPCLAEGMREGVVERWHREGLPQERSPEDVFHYDRIEQVPLGLDPLPAWDRWPPGPGDLSELRERFDPVTLGRLPEDWDRRVARWRGRDHILELQLHSGFFLSMGVEGWDQFEEVIFLLKDQPELVREVMMIRGRFAAAMARRVLREVSVDFASFSEPIAGGDGALISPRDYEQVIMPGYRPVLDLLHEQGVQTVVFKTYANARNLLRSALRAGFNCIWAVEPGTEQMDYRRLREQFGPELGLIGGIDLDSLLAGEAAIRRQFQERVRPLLSGGRYIPLADGRIRRNVPYSRYCCYRELLEAVAREA